MKTAIIEIATRALTHYPAPGQLPEGGSHVFIELSDADGALIGQANARYAVGLDGRLIVTPVPVVPPEPSAREILRAELETATTLAAVKTALLKWAKAA